MTEWRNAQLGDVLTLQRGFDLPLQNRKIGTVPIVGSTGAVGKHSEYKVKGPGVVIGRSGSIGGGQLISEDFWPLNTTLWVKDFKGNNVQYCYYLIKSIDFSTYNVGSGVPTLNRNHIHPHPVLLAPEHEQKAISSVLGALDNKIENNRKMNETLEEMARAIFKSWFVDFDPVHAKAAGNAPAHMDADTAALFPSSFSDDGLPVGWVNGYLKDFTNIVYGKNLPTKQLAISGYPVFGGNGVIGFHSEFLYEEPQVLVACRGAASGKVIRSLPFSFVTNNSLVIRINSPHLNRFFLELYLKDLTLEGFTTGSAQPQMTIANMDAVKLLNPKKEILSCFKTTVEPLFNKVLANDEETQTLAELRDTILPKLMSGEIRVADAEREVKAAV